MAPLDVVTAQSEVASREEGVILAENALAEAEDDLKRAHLPAERPGHVEHPHRPHRPPHRRAHAGERRGRRPATRSRTAHRRRGRPQEPRAGRLQPAVRPEPAPAPARPRGELRRLRRGRHAAHPRRASLGGPVVDTIPGGYGDALCEVFGADFPTWTVGFNVSYAIPNRSREGERRVRPAQQEQTLASFRRLELQVAAEVRTAARGVESGFKRVASTQAARRLAAERLDAEEKKFAAGMSTNFLVTQAQRDLATAAVNDLRAVADYRKSVINYQRVQEAGRLRQRRGGRAARGSSRPRPGRPSPPPTRPRRPPSRAASASSRRRSDEKGGRVAPLSLSPVVYRLFTASDAPGPSLPGGVGLNW